MEQSAHQKTFFFILAAASSFLIFMTSEKCFVDADVKNAIKMVQTLQASEGAPTIPEALVQEHPEATLNTIAWRGQLNDSFYGIVNVIATVPGAIEYSFDVNLAGQRLHPGNDRARALMDKLRQGTLSGEESPPTLGDEKPDGGETEGNGQEASPVPQEAPKKDDPEEDSNPDSPKDE